MSTIQVVAPRHSAILIVEMLEPGHTYWSRTLGHFSGPGAMVMAKDYCRRCIAPDGSKFRIVGADVDPSKRMARFARLGRHQLERRGLMLGGDVGVCAATDDLLDRWWGKKAKPTEIHDAPPMRESKIMRSLRLEFPGHDVWSVAKVRGMKPWVAAPTWGERSGRSAITNREFAEPSVDYAAADKIGARGVMLCFMLRQAQVYEVFDRARPLGPRRVFIRHDGVAWRDIAAVDAEELSCS